MRYLFIVLLVFVFIHNQAYSQQSTEINIDQAIDEYYGTNTSLVNGRYFENVYFRDIGHPFLYSDEFITGSIVLNGIHYEDQKIMYNIFDQNVVLYSQTKDQNIAYLPPLDYLTEFRTIDKLFRKYSIDGDNFYQVVYDGDIKCLYYWYKKRSESDHTSVMAHRYSEEKRKSYLFVNDELMQYSSKGSFINTFPKGIRKYIKGYIKDNSIHIKIASEKELFELLSYCESLLIKGESDAQ